MRSLAQPYGYNSTSFSSPKGVRDCGTSAQTVSYLASSPHGILTTFAFTTTGGFLELSVGIANSKSISRSACLLGFSGVSIMCQVSAVCKGELNNAYLVAAKLFQGAVMGTIARFL